MAAFAHQCEVSMEETTAQTPPTDTRELLDDTVRPSEITADERRRQLRVADWANAYLGTTEGQAAVQEQARRTMSFDWGYTAPRRLQIEPMQTLRWHGGITPIPVPQVGDDARQVIRTLTDLAYMQAYPAYVTEPVEPQSGYDRSIQVEAYRLAMNELAGRRLHDVIVDAMGDPVLTNGHGDGPCGRVDCCLTRCRNANPAVPANDALTSGTIRDAARALRFANYGMMPHAEYRRLYEQEWAPAPGVYDEADIGYRPDLSRDLEPPRQGALTADQRLYYQMGLINRLMPTPTPEEQERERLLVREREEQRRQAQDRARGLLLEKLTPEQQQTWEESRWVEVKGSASRRTYRIKRGVSMNIDCPEAGWTYCAAPANAHETPVEDVVLAQILWLTCDENGFLTKTNRSPYYGPGRPFTADYMPAMNLIDDRTMRTFGRPTRPAPRPPQPRPQTAATCASLGCEVQIDEAPGGARTVYHNGTAAIWITDIARGFSAREIRRNLERRFHA